MRSLVQCFAWLTIGFLVFSSLVPGQFRPSIGLFGGLEHALAYAVAAGIFTVSYHSRGWSVLIGLSTLAGLLEILQWFASGRHSQFADFFAGCLGVIAGSLLAQLLRWFMNASTQQK